MWPAQSRLCVGNSPESLELWDSAPAVQNRCPALWETGPAKTKFNNPPVPRTEVPTNPCTDKAGGGVSSYHKGAAKCTIAKSPQCYKLQERFLNIQAGVQDEYNELVENIDSLERWLEVAC